MLFKRSVYVYLTILTLVLVGTAGSAFSAGLEDTVVPMVGLSLSKPTGIATDLYGNVYIADTGNNKVIMATVTGVTTLQIGTGAAGFTPTTGSTGLNTNLADTTIQLNAPTGVAVDALGNVYIADTGNHRIHKIYANTTTKVISTASKIITVAGNGVAGFSGDGALSTLASLNRPTSVDVDAAGTLYIADNGNYRIRKSLASTLTTANVFTAGAISTLLGDGNPTTLAAAGVAFSPVGDLYIADTGNNRILKLIKAAGLPITVAGTGAPGFSGDGGLATLAVLNQPSGITIDGANIYIADTMNSRIRKISLATGVISTRVGTSVQKTAGTAPIGSTVGATTEITYPISVAVDASGGVYIADGHLDIINVVYASISAITTATPPGGTYSTLPLVTLTSSKSATIYYTLTGAQPVIPVLPALPTPPTLLYTVPIALPASASTVLTFTSVDTATNKEIVNTGSYVFDATSPVTTATISATAVNGIIYSAPSMLNVTLSLPALEPTSTAIYYTTTGTAPTAVVANKYTMPFSIPVTSTLTTTNVQFFAQDATGNKEFIQSQKYAVVALNTTALPVGGVYKSAQTVTLTSNDPTAGMIYYTTNGADPTSTLTATNKLYSSLTRVPISANTTLKYRAVDANSNLEPTNTQIYTIDGTTPTTTASPTGFPNSFASPQTVTLACDDQNATIYYTVTGIAPTTASAKYTAPINITKTTTVMFLAIDQAGNREAAKTEVYTFDDIAPITTASILTGTYSFVQSVALTITPADPKAKIYYTIDGTLPTATSYLYSAPITIDKSMVLRYFAVDAAGNTEVIKEQDYTFITLTTTASPSGGVFKALPTVALVSNGVSAKIYYTLDGTPPTAASTLYTIPILMVNASTTLQFISVDGSGVTESVRTEIYSVDSVAPTTKATCGIGVNTIKLAATDAIDLKPQITYIASTTTGKTTALPLGIAAYTPTAYTTPITFELNTIVKFFATDAAGNTEQIKTAYCPKVTLPVDSNPALYLETLADGAITSNGAMYMRGNVAPFATATLDVNTVPVTTSTVDGSFVHTFDLTTAGPAQAVTTTASLGANTNLLLRTIDYVAAPGLTPTKITIGKNNGVKAHSVRIPITFDSGYQASAVSADILYNTTSPTNMLINPRVEISKEAAAVGKIASGGSIPDSVTPANSVYRILVMDAPGSTATVSPLPDAIVAYLIFDIKHDATHVSETLALSVYSATDLAATDLLVQTIVPATMDGVANVVLKPGNNIGDPTATYATDKTATLKGVQDALNMLLYPTKYAVDGSVDLNADGIVQISEVQQVLNSYLGM